MSITRHDLLAIMSDIEDGDRIEVEYDSRRSDDVKTMEGSIVEVMVREDEAQIDFVRDDGQRCWISDSGLLMSRGSDYPVTGDIIDVELYGDKKDLEGIFYGVE